MRRRIDTLTLLGMLIAFGGVLGGHYLEEGHVRALLSGTAFMIVIVGSFGAVLVATPRRDVMRALRGFGRALMPRPIDLFDLREQLTELAKRARRDGLLAIEDYASEPDADPFLAKCLEQAVDGNSADSIRETAETDMALAEEDARAAARFWENWGSLCPTIGVLGAVLGLIHVMAKLETPGQIGQGIAVAFVATVYGVGFSNLVCLPLAFKLQRDVERDQVRMNMILEGVVGIQAGTAPSALKHRLTVYLRSDDEVEGAPA